MIDDPFAHLGYGDELQFSGTTGRSATNNNPVNLTSAPYYIKKYGAEMEPVSKSGQQKFLKFKTMEDGYNAGLDQIRIDAGRGHTLASFVNKFAPPHENNTNRLIGVYAKAVGVNPNTPLSQIDPKKLIIPMMGEESSTRIVGDKEKEIYAKLKSPGKSDPKSFEEYQIASAGDQIPGPPDPFAHLGQPASQTELDDPFNKLGQPAVVQQNDPFSELGQTKQPQSQQPTISTMRDVPLTGDARISTRNTPVTDILEKVMPTIQSAAEMGGLVGGGAIGAGASPFLGPVGPVIGAGGGYAIAKKGIEAGKAALGLGPTPTLEESLKQSGKDWATGSMMEMGGQSGAKFLQKGLNIAGEKIAEPILGKIGGHGTRPVQDALGRTAPKDIIDPANIVKDTSGAVKYIEAAKPTYEPSEYYTKALRGKISGREIVDSFKGSLDSIAEKRHQDYISKLAEIRSDPAKLSEVKINLNKETMKVISPNEFDVKLVRDIDGKLSADFSGSTIIEHQPAVEKALKDVADWSDNTAAGLDTLKKRLGTYIKQAGRDTPAEALITRLQKNLGDGLKEAIPEYAKMTEGYSNATRLIKDVEHLSNKDGWSKWTADQSLRRLMSAMRNDREMQQEIIDVMSSKSGKDFGSMLSGYAMRSAIPTNFIGSGTALFAEIALGRLINPMFWPLLVTASPRIQGEFLQVWGKGLSASTGMSIPVSKIATYFSMKSSPEQKQAALESIGESLSETGQKAKLKVGSDLDTFKGYIPNEK